MDNKDFVIEAILSIEDFDNVDEKLMETINSNSEYRRIFEEYKEISALTSECVPKAEKGGVTLHDAVMDRVRNGDTAPKYINTAADRRFRFPVATVASLAIVLVAAVIASNASKLNRGYDAAENFMSYDSNSIEDSGSILSKTKGEEFKYAPTRKESISASEAVADEDDYGFVAYSANDEKEEAVTEKYIEVTDNYSNYSIIPETGIVVSDDVQNVRTQPAAGNADTAINDSAVTGGEKKKSELQNESESETDIDAEIASRLEFANKHSISEESIITVEDIEAYGKESFIAWFDSIADSEKFTELYSKKQFIRYCTELWATE